MASKKTEAGASAPAGNDIDPNAQYDVVLNSKVKIGPITLLPRHHNVVRGDTLLTILDSVDTYVLAE